MKTEAKIKIEEELEEVVNKASGLRIGDQVAGRCPLSPVNPENIWLVLQLNICVFTNQNPRDEGVSIWVTLRVKPAKKASVMTGNSFLGDSAWIMWVWCLSKPFSGRSRFSFNYKNVLKIALTSFSKEIPKLLK